MKVYNVQDFSLNRFKRLSVSEIHDRYEEEFRKIAFRGAGLGGEWRVESRRV